MIARQIAMLLVALPAAAAAELACHHDRTTDAFHCIEPAEVQQRGALRVAPLYRGGPERVRRTAYSVAVDCAHGVVHLKDADGVSFALGTRASTDVTATLARAICDLPGLNLKRR